MEERVPPVIDKDRDRDYDLDLDLDQGHDQEHENDSLPVTDPDPILRSGTYVVQVPKDQVYRVPPPENALIAERHRNPTKRKRSCSCLCVLVTIIAIVVVMGLIVGISYIVLKPNDPDFYIENVVVKNPSSNHSNPDFTITLEAENPNRKSSISYEKGGDASLSFEEHKLATGKYPTFNQDYKNSKVFDIALHGSNTAALPKKIAESLKSQKTKVQVSLSLSINVEIKMDIAGVTSKTKKINVSCNLTVDSLAKDTRVLSQECNTNS